MTTKRFYNSRAYFLILFVGIHVLSCLEDLFASLAFPFSYVIREFFRSWKSAELIFFPYCLDPVLYSFFHSDLFDNLMLVILSAITGFAMGSKRDQIWKICLKVCLYVLVSFVTFYQCWCFLAETAPKFPPELSLYDWIELGRGK